MLPIDKQRFSWAIFLICMAECLLWSIPMVSATYDVSSLYQDEAFKVHIAKDKDLFTHSNTLNNIDIKDNAENTQKVQETYETRYQDVTSGKERNQPTTKWNILTLSVATVMTFLFGFSQSGDVFSEGSTVDETSNGKNHDQIKNVDTQKNLDVNYVENIKETEFLSHITDYSKLSDEEVCLAVESGHINSHELENKLNDTTRAVVVRRMMLERELTHDVDFSNIPFENYNYDSVLGKCCENVVGYVPIPVGVISPVLMNGKLFKIPMATTEGCLVASTQRGCKAISMSGGANAVIVQRGMTRGPLVRMPNAIRAAKLKEWLESKENAKKISEAFNSTTSFGKLQSTKVTLAGRNVYIRFKATTGDAMGMNMISKGVEKALELLQSHFEDMEIVAISGNYCTDKKPSSINWIEGRGRSIVVDAIIKGEIIEKVLKTTVEGLVDVNINKNLVGSAMAGSVGGFNAHASNILTAIFLATGQDPAQNVESSNCITLMEPINDGKDLYMSVTMPSIEVGTVGGGTSLSAQSAFLEMMQCKGSSKTEPGSNADQLALLIATAVMGGELSLLSAISTGNLVKSHMALNRSKEVGIVIPCSKL